MGLVLITDYADYDIDMRYASQQNILHRPLTQDARPRLESNAAQELAEVAKALTPKKLRLVVWDAYRDPAVQTKLIAVVNDERYALKESNHCKGLAVDVTVADMDGALLDMGTDHDDFSAVAHSDAKGISKLQRTNRELLRNAMEHSGHFRQWPYEWWHFDYIN